MVRSIPLRGTPSAHRDKASQPSSSRFIRNLIRAPYVHHRFIYRLVTVSPNRKHREMEILSRCLTTLYRLLGKSHQLCHWISYERSQAIDPFGIQCSKANRKKRKKRRKIQEDFSLIGTTICNDINFISSYNPKRIKADRNDLDILKY